MLKISAITMHKIIISLDKNKYSFYCHLDESIKQILFDFCTKRGLLPDMYEIYDPHNDFVLDQQNSLKYYKIKKLYIRRIKEIESSVNDFVETPNSKDQLTPTSMGSDFSILSQNDSKQSKDSVDGPIPDSPPKTTKRKPCTNKKKYKAPLPPIIPDIFIPSPPPRDCPDGQSQRFPWLTDKYTNTGKGSDDEESIHSYASENKSPSPIGFNRIIDTPICTSPDCLNKSTHHINAVHESNMASECSSPQFQSLGMHYHDGSLSDPEDHVYSSIAKAKTISNNNPINADVLDLAPVSVMTNNKRLSIGNYGDKFFRTAEPIPVLDCTADSDNSSIDTPINPSPKKNVTKNVVKQPDILSQKPIYKIIIHPQSNPGQPVILPNKPTGIIQDNSQRPIVYQHDPINKNPVATHKPQSEKNSSTVSQARGDTKNKESSANHSKHCVVDIDVRHETKVDKSNKELTLPNTADKEKPIGISTPLQVSKVPQARPLIIHPKPEAQEKPVVNHQEVSRAETNASNKTDRPHHTISEQHNDPVTLTDPPQIKDTPDPTSTTERTFRHKLKTVPKSQKNYFYFEAKPLN